ncbi:MAG TPA: GNAT family N-acetyltransferase [Ornithinicoccus sp.]|nr:GNAT family N-acetyltransferase [Ornithinicoccus sp.]
MSVTIRRAEPEDLDAIRRFAEEVVPAHYTPILGEVAAHAQLDWWTDERMRPAVEAGRVHVAVADDAIVGVVQTGPWEDTYVVWKLYLSPAFRGRSLGRQLLNAAIEPLREETDHVFVEHFAGNTGAAAFYERLGWKVERTVPARSGDPNAAVVWRRYTFDRETS